MTVFSAPRPPTVALLCGNDGGMRRSVLLQPNCKFFKEGERAPQGKTYVGA